MKSRFEHAQEPLFLQSDGRALFAWVHSPQVRPASLGVVICPPLFDEHIAVYRVLRDLAETLAERGIATLRFDPPGMGDSEGEASEATPERVGRAARAAAGVLAERAGATRIGFLGVRHGCDGARLAAEGLGGLLVAWAPILDPVIQMRELLRRQVLAHVMYGGTRVSAQGLLEALERGEGVDIGGYWLTGAYYEAIRRRPFDPEDLSSPSLVLQVTSPPPGEAAGRGDPQMCSGKDARSASPAKFWEFPREGSRSESPQDWTRATLEWLESHASQGRWAGGA